ncbi:MAG: TetR family transcriptional regulator [Acidimicrobiales bacterium]|nr:TetR family transcriptional regulator [Acidimicrobiales bacterium]
MAGGVAELLTGRMTEIIDAARDLLEAGGPEAVTMRAIAERLGIKAPSLYKHFPDKEALEAALVAAGYVEQAEAFAAAGRSRNPLAALARAYRRWAMEHPHLYMLMTNRPLERDRLPDGVEAAAAAPIVKACGGNPDRARAAWAFAHGMTSLELANRFPPDADLDAAWRSGIDALQAPHATQPRSTT